MARNPNGIILENQVWAETGDKTSPSFDPETGWDITYSQPGGNKVLRELMNYNFNQLTAVGYDVNRYGANLPWYDSVTYEIGAIVIGTDNNRYEALLQNSNIDPVTDTNINWKPAKTTYTTDTNISATYTDNTNTVNLSLTENLNNLLQTNLSNLIFTSLFDLFEAGTGITITNNSGKIKIDNTADSSVFMLRDTSNITTDGEIAVFNRLFNVGVTYSFLENNEPPYQNISGVAWELQAEGNAIVTGDNINSGAVSGTNRLDTGTTDGHSLLAIENGPHQHLAPKYVNLQTIKEGTGGEVASVWVGSINGGTTIEGSGTAHSHTLNVKNIKIKLWKRIS